MNRALGVLATTLALGIAAVACLAPVWRKHVTDMDLERRLHERVAMPPQPHPACAAGRAERPLVLLALGQSNAGNHGQADSHESAAVYLVNGSGCIQAHDPLPGATGRGGSLWTRLPSHLERTSLTRPVWLSLLAVDASSSDDWTRDDSPLRAELKHQANTLSRAGLPPDLVLWQQGEADARQGVPAKKYEANLRQLAADLREAGITAPVVLARSTVCRSEPSRPIRSAIEALTESDPHFVLGPDTDMLNGGVYRHDGCHFSIAGRDAAALQWARVIVNLVAPRDHESRPN